MFCPASKAMVKGIEKIEDPESIKTFYGLLLHHLFVSKHTETDNPKKIITLPLTM